MATPATVAKKLHDVASKHRGITPKIITHGPWALGFTPAGHTAPGAPPTPLNILSIKIRPGHSTTEEDWGWFGGLLAQMGVPKDVVDEQIADDTENTPKGSYYFLWAPETRH